MNGAELVAHCAAAASALLAVPAAVFATECALGCAPGRRRGRTHADDADGDVRVAVVVPAHDEGAGVAPTIASVLPQLRAGDRLVVVADNCSDDTAAQARAAAARVASAATCVVAERVDPTRRGKGHALAHALALLADDPPHAVAFVDADCRVVAGSLRAVAVAAHATGRPAQADNTVVPPAGAGPLARLGAFAFLVRNRVRPCGMSRLGLPVPITGTGFALPWALTGRIAGLGGELVEDLVLGLELARDGHGALLAPTTRIESAMPAADAEAGKQRRRWEHGQLAAMTRHAPRLLLGALAGRPRLLGVALDLTVPPLALLASLLAAAVALGALAWLWSGDALALTIAAAATAAVTLATLLAWAVHARRLLPARELLRIPLYVLWKLPSYAAFLWRRESAWRRTQRDDARPPSA